MKARLDSLEALATPSSGTLASGAISYQRVGTGTGAMVFVWTTGGWNASTVTLPAGFRPAAIVTTPGRNSGGTTDVVVINTTGTIQAAVTGLGFTASFAAA